MKRLLNPLATSLPLLLTFLLPGLQANPDKEERPPNFIILFADDLGYGDLASFGHPTIQTPHLDKMAEQGLKLTSFYVGASVCTPSRAALLTGRHAVRSGMGGNPTGGAGGVLYPDSTGGLPEDEITIATALKESDYATAAIGKWHLGHLYEYLPLSHGFDSFFGLPYSNDMNLDPDMPRHKTGMDPDGKTEWWNEPLMRDYQIIERPANQHTLTKRYTEEGIRFIKKNQDRPFFLYLAYAMPHVPLFASEAFEGRSKRGRYGDTVEEIDWSAGQIMQTLRNLGLAENTLVIFTSDNGPWLKKRFAGGSAGLLKDGKGGTWEGGFREPAIAWWPGVIPAGRISSDIVSTLDLFPTFMALSGTEMPADRDYDGYDLTAFLRAEGSSPRDTMFYYRGIELYAVRKGPYKAHFQTFYGYSNKEPERHDPPLLFNLNKDPGENYNVAEDHPEIVEELVRLAEEHKAKMVMGKPVVERGKERIPPGTKREELQSRPSP